MTDEEFLKKLDATEYRDDDPVFFGTTDDTVWAALSLILR